LLFIFKELLADGLGKRKSGVYSKNTLTTDAVCLVYEASPAGPLGQPFYGWYEIAEDLLGRFNGNNILH